ncbi:hypothetical protein LA080_001022 [Diaporthe eres]|nr:hypothetical protein LA080_001022 [Diaporthe eres]
MSNDQDPAQSWGNPEEIAHNGNANDEWEPDMDDWFDLEGASEDPKGDQAQQDQGASPPAGPSVESFQNSQVQQAQNNAQSTNFLSLENVQDQQAQNPPGNIDQEETFPIPSVMDPIQDPGEVPYELEGGQKDCILLSDNPSMDLLFLDAKVRLQIQQGQNSPNNSNSRETRPIPSIKGMDRGRSDGPYDPHEEPLYTVLHTGLSRTEAKDLRTQIRTRGLNVFSEPDWEPMMQQKGSGWRHKHHVGRKWESLTTIRRGNRRGFNRVLCADGHRKAKRLSIIVQQDGGEVLVEGIICQKSGKKSRTPTSFLMEIFDGFNVASIYQLGATEPASCLVEFVKPADPPKSISAQQ